MVHFRCFLDRNTFQWLRSLNSSGKYLYQSCYRKELCLIDGMRLVYTAIKVYQRPFWLLVTKFKYVIFFVCISCFLWFNFFFFRSIQDIIVVYCIYVDMKVIAMKANIRSSNNDQIYGKVHTWFMCIKSLFCIKHFVWQLVLILIHIYVV